MSTPFQNRLVGTIIVAAAITIFLPDILDGKKISNQADFDAIPNAPTFTGKIASKSFPVDKLVVKEKPIVFNEVAKDEQLVKKNSTKTNTVTDIKPNTAKVSPAVKAKEVVSNDTKLAKGNLSINKPKLGQQPASATNQEAWVIHLGSFKNKSNVTELINKLNKNGYSAYTKPIQTKQGTLTKVFVGPELIKSSLTKKLPALKSLTNVQGKVARFYPTQ